MAGEFPAHLALELEAHENLIRETRQEIVVLTDARVQWALMGQQQEALADEAREQVQVAQKAWATSIESRTKHDDYLIESNLKLPKNYRPEGPPHYHGRPGEDLEAWLFQVKESNELFPINEEMQRVRYVALSLRDTAALWYAAVQMKEPPEINDWETFVTKLRKQFMSEDQTFKARNLMHSLKQTGSVRAYSVKYRSIQLLIPNVSEEEQVDRYIRGLKDFAWRVWRKKHKTLNEAMIYAEELDLEIRQKQILSIGSTNSNGKQPRETSSIAPILSRQVPWLPRVEPRGESVPMELGVLRMDETERKRHMQQNLCFNCHKPGHAANVCPAKKGLLSGNGDRRR
jgi:hypothetical protein